MVGPVVRHEAIPIPGLDPLASAIVAAIVYADVFDWPLTPSEIHRALPLPARLDEVDGALATPGPLDGLVEMNDGFVMLPGREGLAAERRRRMAASRDLWRRAARTARAIGALPLVRMVAVTGSLAVGAADADADVDLLVVTEDDRLWLTRAMTIGVVRAAAAAGVRLCPNYFLAESALELSERDLFTAHELVQMVPIAGWSTYLELLRRNAWYRAFLPNHPGHAAAARAPRRPGAGRLLEPALRSAALNGLERWEMQRKVARLRADATSGEQQFDEAVCKGHFEEHGQLALAAYRERLTQIAGAAA